MTAGKKNKVVLLGDLPVKRIPSLGKTIEEFKKEFDMVFPKETKEESLYPHIEDAAAVIVPWTPQKLISAETLKKAKELKLILATYGGIKRNVAAEEALAQGVRLSCTGPARARSVAEFTMGLTLSALLHIPRIHHAMRCGESFPRFGYTSELTAKKIGIIGFGSVTREMMLLLKPFNTINLVYSRHASAEEVSVNGGKKADLDEVLAESEIILILTGLTDKTIGMIGERELSLIPDGGLVVNSARGRIIKENSLINELKKGRLMAALDVYEQEPLQPESPLRSLDNAVITAHSANSTIEMDRGRWEFALDELRSFFNNGTLKGEILGGHLETMSDD